ncbi:aldehyde dehydrogenase family protein [Amycolatopsis echigonensis]|uniref:Aldehyde dehydrogenase n=1 Tax=Amycolatopsis echigonensis TaxID=2576905 RepID=A0A8E1W7Y7_9PSEU|nr:aldehyde dehydrogenase family protein [Amycolatopsis echigonensis]MBB2505160.1 aldehyde dehydrogenase [Amycolatopsis echigonensis]
MTTIDSRDAATWVAALVPAAHLIGGRTVPSIGGAVTDVLDPGTGRVIGRVPDGTPADIDAAVAAASDAFPAWRDLSASRRAAVLHRWGALCTEHDEELGLLESLEVGRPYQGPASVGNRIVFIAGQADKIGGQSLPTATPDRLALTLREPFGVCGCIVPWNAPGALMVSVVAPALAAGNTVVVKPAADAPLTCLLLGELALQAGLPPGVLNVVPGGAAPGAALAEHPGVRHLSFTGSTVTGASVMRAAARNLVPVHLELGGKSPQIVFDDANLEQAVPEIVRGVTFNAGQTCAAGTRVLVQRGSRQRLVDALATALSATRLGGWDEDVDMGPLINRTQQQRVLNHIGIAQSEGAQLVCGGGVPPGERYEHGFFVAPTLFDQVDPAMRLAQEEVFGPVLAVLEFDDLDEAVEIANGTKYGLVATAWTADVGRAVTLARRLEAGQVHVNAGRASGAIGAPFGGYRQSGFGRTMSADSVLEFTQVKSVVLAGTGASHG